MKEKKYITCQVCGHIVSEGYYKFRGCPKCEGMKGAEERAKRPPGLRRVVDGISQYFLMLEKDCQNRMSCAGCLQYGEETMLCAKDHINDALYILRENMRKIYEKGESEVSE